MASCTYIVKAAIENLDSSEVEQFNDWYFNNWWSTYSFVFGRQAKYSGRLSGIDWSQRRPSIVDCWPCFLRPRWLLLIVYWARTFHIILRGRGFASAILLTSNRLQTTPRCISTLIKRPAYSMRRFYFPFRRNHKFTNRSLPDRRLRPEARLRPPGGQLRRLRRRQLLPEAALPVGAGHHVPLLDHLRHRPPDSRARLSQPAHRRRGRGEAVQRGREARGHEDRVQHAQLPAEVSSGGCETRVGGVARNLLCFWFPVTCNRSSIFVV